MPSATSTAPVSHQTVRLERGSHRSPDHGACVMELASMLAGEPFSDRPKTACRVIGAVLRTYNDVLDDQRRQDLYPYASAVCGTHADTALELERARRCIEWAARRRAESDGLRRWLWRRPGLGDDAHPCEVFMRHVTPVLRAGDPGLHRQVLALLDELIATGTPERPAAERSGHGAPGADAHDARPVVREPEMAA